MVNCKECKEARTYKSPEAVPFVVFESAMAQKERMLKRLWQTIILLIVLLVASNGAWLWYESQFEEVVVTQENDNGYNGFIGNDGTINFNENPVE